MWSRHFRRVLLICMAMGVVQTVDSSIPQVANEGGFITAMKTLLFGSEHAQVLSYCFQLLSLIGIGEQSRYSYAATNN